MFLFSDFIPYPICLTFVFFLLYFFMSFLLSTLLFFCFQSFFLVPSLLASVFIVSTLIFLPLFLTTTKFWGRFSNKHSSCGDWCKFFWTFLKEHKPNMLLAGEIVGRAARVGHLSDVPLVARGFFFFSQLETFPNIQMCSFCKEKV